MMVPVTRSIVGVSGKKRHAPFTSKYYCTVFFVYSCWSGDYFL